MKEMISGIVVCLLTLLVVSAFSFGICWWSAGQEANAYYRATGKHVSQWDAMFLELRVQNQ